MGYPVNRPGLWERYPHSSFLIPHSTTLVHSSPKKLRFEVNSNRYYLDNAEAIKVRFFTKNALGLIENKMINSMIPPMGFVVFLLFVIAMTHIVGFGVLYLMFL